MEKKILIIVSSFIILAIIGAGIFLQSREINGANVDADIVSKKGLHWHSELSIIVSGKSVEIPPNVGLEGSHNPVHTHDGEPGVIHMEFPGLVRADDLRLGEFFRIWKKDMRSFGTNMKMTVNGTENTEFENYHMKDGDKIVLIFE